MPENTHNPPNPRHARAAQPSSGQLLTAESPVVMLAQQQLQPFIAHLAADLRTELGFGWIAVPDAPSSYRELKLAYAASVTTKQPLPVLSEHAEGTVFGARSTNIAYRFVHDCLHVKHGLSFSSQDEFVLACHLMDLSEDYGIRRGTVAWHLFKSDAVGQALQYALTKKFVEDQLRFGLDTVNHGLHRALLAEVERHHGK